MTAERSPYTTANGEGLFQGAGLSNYLGDFWKRSDDHFLQRGNMQFKSAVRNHLPWVAFFHGCDWEPVSAREIKRHCQ